MTYFSDREQYHSNKKLSMLIPINVWNGIAMLVNGVICNNNLVKNFPIQCLAKGLFFAMK